MHEQIRAFVDSAAEAFELKGPVYQFSFFPDGELCAPSSLGECFREGERESEAAVVDCKLDAETEIGCLPFPDGAARTVLCVGVLGNALRAGSAATEMARILSPGGTLLVCALPDGSRGDRLPEGRRLTPLSIQRLLAGTSATVVGWQGAETFPHTMYGVGFKPPFAGRIVAGTGRFLDSFQARLDQQAGQIGWRRLRNFLAGCVQGRRRLRQWRDYYRIQFAVHLCADESFKHELLQNCLSSDKTGTRLDLT